MSLLLLPATALFPTSRIQPAIAPDGVMNAASYIPRGFANHGIARGSLFLIFGNYLGPDVLVQAQSFPLAGSDGLAGTNVRIDAGGYTGFAYMVYTSATQVGAILPSEAPEGDATLTLNYNNLTSNPVVIHIVRSAFGIFTLNQGGTGPAVVQNFVSQGQTPLNTLLTSATPGQTVILWGTGLGPLSGGDATGPAPGALPYLDSLYVGGQQVSVRFAGRSGCCAGIDQISFDVPANVSGCYVPVVALTNGIASNFATIAVSPGGGACDDPLSFRAGTLSLARNGSLRVGAIRLWTQTPAGGSVGSDTLTASFLAYSPQTLVMAQAPVNPSAGSCYLTESPVNSDPSALPHGDGLNAGFSVLASGPGASLTAESVSAGNYAANMTPAGLSPGVYSVSGSGGPDVGAIRGSVTVTPPAAWSNASDYTTSIVTTGQPMAFRWTGGDGSGYVAIAMNSVSATLSMSLVCNVPASMGSFTVPAYMTRSIVQGQGAISVGSFTTAGSFSASGLDVGAVTAGASQVVQANFVTPPGTN
ncbi:MAG TPA: hypothetical protein VE959_12005 [Bryobacteraceae bacterium]|nr:hypothetical protein [Bryobacteraceae bacterium]